MEVKGPGRGPRWRDDQISSRLRTRASEMGCKKLEQGGTLCKRGGPAGGLKVENRQRIQARRLAARRTCRGGHGSVSYRQRMVSAKTAGASASEWIVFRLTDVSVPPLDPRLGRT